MRGLGRRSVEPEQLVTCCLRCPQTERTFAPPMTRPAALRTCGGRVCVAIFRTAASLPATPNFAGGGSTCLPCCGYGPVCNVTTPVRPVSCSA